MLHGGSGRADRGRGQTLPARLSERRRAGGWCLARDRLRPCHPCRVRRERGRSRAFARSMTHPGLPRTSSPPLPAPAFPGSFPPPHLLPAAPRLPFARIHRQHRRAPESQHAGPDRALWRHDTVAQFAPTVLPAYLSPFFNSRANHDFASCQSRITVIEDTCNT